MQVTNERNQDETFPFSVSFEYDGHDTFDDISRAMRGFSEAFNAYARDNKKAVIKIVGFEPGSLMCNLVATRDAWTPIQVMAQDIGELQHGRKSTLMPDAARKNFKGVLDHVSALRMDIGQVAPVAIDESASPLLEQRTIDAVQRPTVHSGVLDRVDLKSNQFRIMLPHGQRLTCRPAIPHIEVISDALLCQVPRLRVTGQGRFQKADILPGVLQVLKVEAIKDRSSFLDLIGQVMADFDAEDLTRGINAQVANLPFQVGALPEDED